MIVRRAALRVTRSGFLSACCFGIACSSSSGSPKAGGAASQPARDAPRSTDGGPSAAASTAADASLPLEMRADRCLDDPTCQAAEAERLFIAADDAGESGDCFRFADGRGTRKDARRARACIEREVSKQRCDGNSASLSTAELAVYRIDGVGGPVDIAGARRLLATCYDDVTKSAILEHATAKERDASTRPLDFCKDSGGTTLTLNECLARRRRNETVRAQLQAKSIAQSLDEEGRTRFVAASKAYDAYVAAIGVYTYRVNIDGSIRNAVSLEREHALLERRTTSLAAFWKYKPSSVPEIAAARAGHDADVALDQQLSGASANIKHFAVLAGESWARYRDAEVALYQYAFGDKFPPDQIRRDLIVRLAKDRVADLR